MAASLPAIPASVSRTLDPPPLTASADAVEKGRSLYGRYCSICHGAAAHSVGLVPDLRYSFALADDQLFHDIVIGGDLSANGMVSFKDVLTDEDAEAVRAYLIARANEDKQALETQEKGEDTGKPQ